MGITAAVVCVTCNSRAPEIGDFGYVGYPSLVDAESLTPGFASFEYIYRGYAAIGVHLLELDSIRAWLVEHARHDVGLFLEGERVKPPARLSRSKGTNRVAADKPAADLPAHERAILEIGCRRCKKRWRSEDAYPMRPFERTITKTDVAEFTSRVLDAPEHSFHHAGGLFDPDSDELQGLAEFLKRHRTHQLSARTVAGETWTARPIAATPLDVRWSVADASTGALIVRNGRIYAIGGDREWVVALDDNGREAWRSRKYEALTLYDLFATDRSLILPVYDMKTYTYQLWSIAYESGGAELVAERAPDPMRFLSDRRFIGRSSEPDGRPIQSFGVYELANGVTAVWEREVPYDPGRSFGARLAANDRLVFADDANDLVALELSTGEEMWRTAFEGQPMGPVNWPLLRLERDLLLYGARGTLNAFAADSGALRWSFDSLGERYWTPGNGVIVVAGVRSHGEGDRDGTEALALDASTGDRVWKSATDSRTWKKAPPPRPVFWTRPTAAGAYVYLGDLAGRLWALSASSGEPQAMRGLLGSGAIHGPIVADAGRLLVSHGDQLSCLSDLGAA